MRPDHEPLWCVARDLRNPAEAVARRRGARNRDLDVLRWLTGEADVMSATGGRAKSRHRSQAHDAQRATHHHNHTPPKRVCLTLPDGSEPPWASVPECH